MTRNVEDLIKDGLTPQRFCTVVEHIEKSRRTSFPDALHIASSAESNV
jgi:hypothetical protein